MVAQLRQQLESALSLDRLESYRPSHGNDLDMLAAYFWNVELCESLYPALGALEKAFRNSLSRALEAEFTRPDWYDKPSFLLQREMAAIKATKNNLVREGKCVTPGRIISRQDFGFWTRLFSKGYSVWTESHQRATLCVFPSAPPAMRYRSRLLARINEIRLFRNRVFHYEKVLDGIVLQDGSRIPLLQMHTNIIEAITWINPGYGKLLAQEFDRFPVVYQAGSTDTEGHLRAYLNNPPSR